MDKTPTQAVCAGDGGAVSTIHAVAEKAGVSIKTVSRVLYNASPVSQKTRKKIER